SWSRMFWTVCSRDSMEVSYIFFFQAEDGIRGLIVTGVQTCALPIYSLADRRGDRSHGAADEEAVSGEVDEMKVVLFCGGLGMRQIGRASCRERGEVAEVDGGGDRRGKGRVRV